MSRPVLERDGDARWRIAPDNEMRVPGIVFATKDLLEHITQDESLRQVEQVATLPGIVAASYAMPDVHMGYGFPIGGVAATDVDDGGVISPGGVGFDISCGVRLHTTRLTPAELGARLDALMDRLDQVIPRGLGKGAVWDLSRRDTLREVLVGGARAAIRHGFGDDRDLARIEDGGALTDADPGQVSDRAVQRGISQMGSLGAGNHFLEIQVVDEIVDPDTASAFGLEHDQVCVMIHTGSRGLGHQICQDHVRGMQRAMTDYGIQVPDRQLACAPVDSVPGRAYLGAMAAGANFGRANRQLLGEATRDAFEATLGTRDLPLLYDVSHNLAKIEEHEVDGSRKRLCVHRKGATLALPPRHPDLNEEVREAGQPVLVPGSMGTGSWLMVGMADSDAFHSSCHGAGRMMSRKEAKKQQAGAALRDELAVQGIAVRPGSVNDLSEEAPYAYKDVDAVVASSELAGLAQRVARLRPLGVVKG